MGWGGVRVVAAVGGSVRGSLGDGLQLGCCWLGDVSGFLDAVVDSDEMGMGGVELVLFREGLPESLDDLGGFVFEAIDSGSGVCEVAVNGGDLVLEGADCAESGGAEFVDGDVAT